MEKWNPKKEYEKIMSTTEIGDTVVLIEKEKNMYKRKEDIGNKAPTIIKKHQEKLSL